MRAYEVTVRCRLSYSQKQDSCRSCIGEGIEEAKPEAHWFEMKGVSAFLEYQILVDGRQ